ncbi:MAG: ribokinase [Caulobacteraceae bacterium]|nr:ribokinase [Caulobacteraceae bacterium]
MTSAEIVVVGSYNRDVSLSVERMPAPGETCLGLGRVESPGGKGSNQAIQAARCGAPTAMVAAIGHDAAGDEALALWSEAGVVTSGVARLAGQGTGMAVILVDARGENAIVVDSGANAHLAPEHVDAAATLIGGARLVVAQLETPVAATVRAFEIARAAGAATLLNAAPAPEAIDGALLALTDFLVVNEIEGKALSGHETAAAIGETLLGRVGKGVIVTLGAEGAMLFEHHRPPHRQSSSKVEVVDTTGAGDAFTGAFAARWIATGDAPAALAWGVAAGALACTAQGAAASYADRDRIAALAGA